MQIASTDQHMTWLCWRKGRWLFHSSQVYSWVNKCICLTITSLCAQHAPFLVRRVNPRKHRKAESFHSLESIVAVEGSGCIADFALCQAGLVGLWHLQAYNTSTMRHWWWTVWRLQTVGDLPGEVFMLLNLLIQYQKPNSNFSVSYLVVFRKVTTLPSAICCESIWSSYDNPLFSLGKIPLIFFQPKDRRGPDRLTKNVGLTVGCNL